MLANRNIVLTGRNLPFSSLRAVAHWLVMGVKTLSQGCVRTRILIQGSYLLLFLASAILASSPTSALVQNQNQLLTVATVDNFLPCSDKYHNGYRGLSIDLWHTISSRNSINYKLKSVSTFDKAVEAAANNDVDLVISCHEINKERAGIVDFSVPYTYGGIGILSRKKRGLTFSFVNRLLANEKIVRCTLLLLIATSLAALALKGELEEDNSYSRIWTMLIMGSGTHAFINSRKSTHLYVLTITIIRLVLISIIVGTSATIVFDSSKPKDASKLNKEQFASLLREGITVRSETATEEWIQMQIENIYGATSNFSKITPASSTEQMLSLMKEKKVNHIVTNTTMIPRYIKQIGESDSFHMSFKMSGQTPQAFIFGTNLHKDIRRTINGEIAALNRDGTITDMEERWDKL